MHVIEFQKRGLPHAHILIILEDDSKLFTAEDYDSVVSAEIPDKIIHPQAYKTVTTAMIHGPCGILNPKSTCMEEGKCTTNYPKDFVQYTNETDDSYPVYRRRDQGVTFKNDKLNCEVDNRWVVPHNLYLVTKYDCHINVEICSSVKAVSYLYKYIYKGI